jgi:hypothetical protein
MEVTLMSTSERHVELITNNPLAEILLVDGDFRVVARGPSPLKAKVPAGLYGMKVKVGDEQTEEVLAIAAGEQVFAKTMAAPLFESPIPLDATSTSHEFHQAKTSQATGQARAAASDDVASIVVCVRDPSRFVPGDAESAERMKRYAGFFERFSVIDLRGKTLASFAPLSQEDMDLGYSSISLAVPPGAYALAYRLKEDSLCTSLPAVKGWALQVFVNVVSNSSGELVPDFQGMAIFYDSRQNSFEPWRDDLVAVETIRKSWLLGRSQIGRESLDQLYAGKFSNPMLGIYAAHHLLAVDPESAELDAVLKNTGRMLGENFPDLVAIRMDRQDRRKPLLEPEISASLRAVTGPPLLARSWDLFVKQAARLPVQSSAASPMFSIASGLAPQGVFVCWMRKAGQEVAAPVDNVFSDVAKAVVVDGAGTDIVPSMRSMLPGLDVVLRLTSSVLSRIQLARKAPSVDRLAGQLAAIKDVDSASAAVKSLAEAYDWERISLELRKNPSWLRALTPLQQSLVITLGNVNSSESSLVSVTPKFIAELLQAHRVPLQTLADDLKKLELGGWMTQELTDAASSLVKAGSRQLHHALDRFRTP